MASIGSDWKLVVSLRLIKRREIVISNGGEAIPVVDDSAKN